MDINLKANTPLQIETRLIENLIAQLERSVGLENDAKAKQITPLGIWQTARDLYFSVPTSPDSGINLSEREKDAQFAQFIGMRKTAFLHRTEIRIAAIRKRQAAKAAGKR